MNNPYSLVTENNGNNEIIDLNTSNYSLNDILNILDISINTLLDKSNEEIYNIIETKVDSLIEKFENLNLKEFVDFFKNIKTTVINLNTKQDVTSYELSNSADKSEFSEYNENIFKNEYDKITNIQTLKKGNVNPIDRQYVQKLINIDSKFRKNYSQTTSTNFIVELPAKINNVVEMKLNELEMVNTYYVISDDYENNYFWMKLTTTTGSYAYVFVFLDPQSYYENHIIQKLNSRFTSLGLGINVKIDLGFETLRSIPVGTGKMTFEVTDTRIIHIEFHFESASLPSFKESTIYNNLFDQHQFVYVSKVFNRRFDEDELFERIDLDETIYSSEEVEGIYNETTQKQLTHKLGWMFGFRSNIVEINVVQSVDGTAYGKIEGDAIINFSGPKYFFLHVNDYNQNFNTNLYTTDDRGIIQSNTFARINQTGRLFSLSSNSNYQITTIPRHYFGPVTIEKLEIKIFDEYGNIINLNGNDISMTFTVTSKYSQMGEENMIL